MRLLLVEDDSRIVSFVSKGLKEAGFVVVHAADGQSGLQLALDASYDAAVIDIMLPGMDGLALIEELRRRRIRLPVIILSARRTVDDLLHRTLWQRRILCLSPVAVASDWVGLACPAEVSARRRKRSTVRVRDPSNAGHRFTRLLLAAVQAGRYTS